MRGEQQSLDSGRRPNFFLIGAAKSGTTSLAKYLDQHPDVFVSRIKEPNFFAFPSGQRPSCAGPCDPERLYELLLKYTITDPDEYAGLFAAAGTAAAVGEASVRYLATADAADRIAAYAPGARIVVILREPAARMYSHYHMNAVKNLEPASFGEALRLEDERVASGWGFDWHYRRLGAYAEQLARFLDRFGEERVLVLWYDDLVRDPQGVCRACFAHLGVDVDFAPDTERRQLVGRTPRYPWLRRLIWNDNPLKKTAQRLVPTAARKGLSAWVERHNQGSIPRLGDSERSELAATFRDANARLADLLGRTLPW